MEKAGSALSIGSGNWHFTNAPWQDGEDGELLVPQDLRRQDGERIQGHHHAFALDQAFQDVQVSFEFRLTPHSDIGIVLRARNERDFYLFHLPDCGQASRSQHFWAAFSKMDHTGYLKRIRLELLRRVPTLPREWMRAEIRLEGNRLRARIGEHGVFEAGDATYPGPGRVGLYLTGNAQIRRVQVSGTPAAGPAWDARTRQPRNWIHPVPQERIWQKPQDLVRLPGGEVLLSYTLQAGTGTTTGEEGSQLLVRSADGGRSWSAPEALQVVAGPVQAWWPPRLHLTPVGRLIALLRGENGYAIAESTDGARTWSAPVPTNIPLGVPMVEKLHLGPQAALNLADGSMVLLLYGAYALGDLHGPWTWGSAHCQAYSVRSTDEGRTWSAPVNVDNQGLDRESKPVPGNLDLTEVCAAQMSDGRILALVRPIFSPWMWETWSHDGGASWGPCVPGPFPGYATPNMLRTRSGAVLVAHRLPSLSLNTSHDEGRTWDQGTLIDSGLWCMGAMAEVEPDVVLYVYWDSYESLMRAQRLRVTAAGLEPLPPG